MPGKPLGKIGTAISDILKATEIAVRDLAGAVWSGAIVTIFNLLPGDYTKILNAVKMSESRRIQNVRSEYMRVLAKPNEALLSGDGAMFLMALNPGYYATAWLARRTYDRNPLIAFSNSDMGKLYAGITAKFDQGIANKARSTDDLKKQVMGKKGLGGIIEALRELFFGSGEIEKVMAKKEGVPFRRGEPVRESKNLLREESLRFETEQDFVDYLSNELGIENINDMIKYLGVNQSTQIDAAVILKGRIDAISKLEEEFRPAIDKIKKLLIDDTMQTWVDALGDDNEIIREINNKTEKILDNPELVSQIIEKGNIFYTGEDDMQKKVRDFASQAIFERVIIESRDQLLNQMEDLKSQFLATIWEGMPRPDDGYLSDVWLYQIDGEGGKLVEEKLSEEDFKNLSPLAARWAEHSKNTINNLFGTE